MEDIMLNGVSVQSLVETRKNIKQAAAKFISEGIEKVTGLVQLIVDSKEDTDMAAADQYAREALKILESVDVVSGVSGVTYYLNYYEEYSGSCGILSRMVEDVELDSSDLYYMLEEMESTSRGWHSSTC